MSIEVNNQKCFTTQSGKSCFVQEQLDIHEPVVLNFIDADGWNDMEYLHIGPASNVSVFPSGIFGRFPKLKKLAINSALSSIKKTDILNATELTYLDLFGNYITALASNVFEHAKNLERIQLSTNDLNTIEDFAFNGLNSLLSLHLSDNNITALKRNTFAGAANILAIYLVNNRIETIEDGAFNLPNLEQLELNNNRLNSLSDCIFSGAPKLERLLLSSNQLTRIGESLHNLQNVDMISIDHNPIQDINLAALVKLPKLKWISMKNTSNSFDNINELPNGSLISYLTLSDNKLSNPNILDVLKPLSNLQLLGLDNNNFSDINGLDDIKTNFVNISRIILWGNNDYKLYSEELQQIVIDLRLQNVGLFIN